MSKRKRRSHQEEIAASLGDPESIRQFADAQLLLKRYLVHTREILNGKDFLFLGPKDEIHEALKLLVDLAHINNRFIHVDFAQVDEYFLMRVLGSETDQQVISAYFE